MIRNKHLMEKLNTIQEDIYGLRNVILELPDPMTSDEMKDILDNHMKSCVALNESIEDNLEKLNLMSKELKGVIAMSRVSLKSCKKVD